MSDPDAVIVGAGLFGQVIAAELRRQGMETLVIDSDEPFSGSRPSASLMKPSWFSGMGRQVTDPALELLDHHYGVQDLTFKVGPLKTDSVRWCDPAQIMGPGADVLARVNLVDFQEPGVRTIELGWIRAQLVVVAAGVWSSSLIPVPDLQGKVGAACLFPGQLGMPFIRPWAPYKQLVAFNVTPDTVWVGDGSALKPESWTEARQEQSVARCHRAVDDLLPEARASAVLVGTRPYVPKKHLQGRPCYLREHKPGVWVATGGAKNGTIAAGWCAHVIGESIS